MALSRRRSAEPRRAGAQCGESSLARSQRAAPNLGGLYPWAPESDSGDRSLIAPSRPVVRHQSVLPKTNGEIEFESITKTSRHPARRRASAITDALANRNSWLSETSSAWAGLA